MCESIEYVLYAILTNAYNKQEAYNKLNREDKIILIDYVSGKFYFKQDEVSKNIMSFFYKEENMEIFSEYLDTIHLL